jgi:hypothetical protein
MHGVNEMKKGIVVFVAMTVVAGIAAFILFRPGADNPRKMFAKNIVERLAANNWDRGAIKPFLCDDKLLKDSFDGSGITFSLYQDYDGIKGVGKVKLTPVAHFPAIAMDTFVPIVFNKTFHPWPNNMPDYVAYHATYIQLSTQETSQGKWCLQGWGRNDIPVSQDQSEDFLNYRGIFSQN